jgi:hypothetical protein
MHWADKARILIERGQRTYRQVEFDADWAQNTLVHAVKHRTDIRVKKAYRLAQALGVSMSWLFDENRGLPPAVDHDRLLQKSAR